MRRVSVALAAAAVTAAVVHAAPAHADSGWVAFVFSPSTWNLSQVWGARDQASTEQAAVGLQRCRSLGLSNSGVVEPMCGIRQERK